MSQAFNVVHAVSRSAPHCACARSDVALPSARSAPCLPPLASRERSSLGASTALLLPSQRSLTSLPLPLPSGLLVLLRAPFSFSLFPSPFLSLSLFLFVIRARAPLSYSRSSPISILFPHFPLRFRRISVVFFFPISLHSSGTVKHRVFSLSFLRFSSSLTP